MNRKALGRGLGALLSSDRTIDLGSEPSEVDLDSIVPGPMQPRTHFDEASLQSLADSIRSHGIVQPLLVQTTWRRLRIDCRRATLARGQAGRHLARAGRRERSS